MDYAYLIFVLMRALALGGIVYYATTTIPVNPLAMRNKVIISVIVVVLFALMDYVGQLLGFIRKWSCRLLCGCTPGQDIDALGVNAAATPTVGLGLGLVPPAGSLSSTASVDTAVEEAIRALQSEGPLHLSEHFGEEAKKEGCNSEQTGKGYEGFSLEAFSNYAPY